MNNDETEMNNTEIEINNDEIGKNVVGDGKRTGEEDSSIERVEENFPVENSVNDKPIENLNTSSIPVANNNISGNNSPDLMSSYSQSQNVPVYGSQGYSPNIHKNDSIQGISFGGAVKRFFTNAFNFSGNASRSEYWWVNLFIFLLYIPFFVVFSFAIVSAISGSQVTPLAIIMLIFFLLSFLFLIIPSLSLSIRRFHDAGFSALWYIIYVVLSSIVGGISAGLDTDISFVLFPYSIFLFVICLLPTYHGRRGSINEIL